MRIYEDKLPLHPSTVRVAEELNMEPITCALSGGEDYELLFTVSPAHFEALAKHSEISIIGHVTSAQETFELVSKSDTIFNLRAQGWESYGSDS